MTLVDCPTCGQQMDVSARPCPHCRARPPWVQTRRRAIIFMTVLIAVLALFLLLYIMSDFANAPTESGGLDLRGTISPFHAARSHQSGTLQCLGLRDKIGEG